MHIPALLQFLAELAENNNRPWFLHNKPHYDILRAEFIDLVTAVGAHLAKTDRALGPLDAKKAVFRIYRDVRFAKDKSPYKTHIGAVIGAGTRERSCPMYYFHVDAKGDLLVACGLWQPEPETLKKVRDFIVAHPRKLTRVLADPAIVATFGGIRDFDRLVRPPKGYDVELPHSELIRNRHFICEQSISLKKRVPKDLAGDVARTMQAGLPLIKWLREAVN